MYDILIVGAGLSGATIAEHAARDGAKVLVIEKRGHIAGNIYDEVDKESNIRVSKYGAHLFHTNDEEIWEYVQKFGPWQRWDHKVVMDISGTYVPVPVTITTVNTLCGTTIMNEQEMREWYAKECIPNSNPQNSEEVALSRVGRKLYETMFKPYTMKQWNKEPKELDPSVLSRIPIRYDFDDRYFSDRYQALPVNGYTSIVENMLSHPNIEVRCNTDWSDIKETLGKQIPIIVFTGPIDVYFKDSGLAPLEYRSIKFVWTKEKNNGYYQPNSVVNYSEKSNPYTRCVEYKHFLHQKSEYTIYSKEVPCDTGEPYYPIPTKENQDLYQKYVELSKKGSNTHFIGRLASYKYFNMDQAIRNAMNYYNEHLARA
jgi:UDP-galactopyranose mutase